MWWLGLLIACGDADRLDELEARIVELEAKQAALEAELAEAKKPTTPPRDSLSPVDLSHWPVREIEPGRYTVDHERMKQLAPPEDWAGAARVVPHRAADGEIDGYRLSGIRRTSVVAALGLQNGDVVHALNGLALVDAESAMSAYELIGRGERLEASITRRGAPMTLVWEPGTVPAPAAE